MKLQPAIRFAHGRCAPLDQTVQRLETALHAHYTCRYEGHEEGEGFHWGRLHIDDLEFSPMGKGTSALACKASTYAEALEWLAVKGRRALPGYEACTPDREAIAGLLAHIALSAEQLNRIMQTELTRHWVDAWSVTESKAVKLPLEYIHGISGTNGLAAGNVIEEAIVQGINEVFERRAVITLVKNRMIVPRIDPSSIEHAGIRAQLDVLEARGLKVTIKDLSFGGALPCIGVYVRDPKVDPAWQSHHVFKAAAHVDRELALMSCLTEYVQLTASSQVLQRPASYARMQCDDTTDNFLPLFWFGYVPFADATFLEEGELIAFEPGVAYDSCLEDIEEAQSVIKLLGLDLMVVDLTDPKIGFPVVQVIIPGYSDILPYHPASSPVLFEGWTRDLPMGYIKALSGSLTPCNVTGLFPDW
ncbi:MAG: YcaO-like protein with predicted kinase domain [Kiritimatiellia bacterium]|jgi:YcaO-like protein with predicted kinase domain